MSDTLVQSVQPRPSPALGGGHFAALVVSMAAGCAIFVVDRKLTWGVDEPMLDAWLIVLGLVPLVVYAALALILPPSPHHRDPAAVRYARLSSVWIVSLILYAAAQIAMVSRSIDDPIYETFGLNLTAFALLTIIYVAMSFVAVWAIAVWRRDRHSRRESDSRELARRMEIVVGATICLPMFLLFVFCLPA
ncbi:hypothetical protein JQ621_32095 [Bradyrhizobium manausense]|uniref:hypothetical protein n=1 Tax=Bradyrhizobium manausense TaxID=989370 RepID=UPI001BA75F0E|nr:hypothetical protein [Bradyrhizobium manausense]MBR1092113.1 hypothetical protein [Bradyrhizobium manausense]